jgi:hypothetical protein
VEDRAEARTYVHAFSVAEPTRTTYEASGVVPGTIYKQFALDERDGYVRVVTNDLDKNWVRQNHLYMLGAEGRALNVVGDSGAFGQDESVFAVRYVGDTAYVVTFRQTDPLFAIDLSDPTSPTILGELHIPGFSEYMHPLGDTHLLTVGQDIDENWNQRVALQIFGVADRTAPQLLHKVVFADDGSTGISSTHKAFTYYAEKQLLAVPFLSYGYDANAMQSRMDLFHVDTTSGFTHLGAVDGSPILQSRVQDYYCWDDTSDMLSRGVFMDDVIFAVAQNGIVAASVDAPATTLASVVFPDENLPSCWDSGWGGTGGDWGGTGGATGGADWGGSGGAATGGADWGGSGGASTGGASSGGASTGGASTGGASTGGSATGGSAG